MAASAAAAQLVAVEELHTDGGHAGLVPLAGDSHAGLGKGNILNAYIYELKLRFFKFREHDSNGPLNAQGTEIPLSHSGCENSIFPFSVNTWAEICTSHDKKAQPIANYIAWPSPSARTPTNRMKKGESSKKKAKQK